MSESVYIREATDWLLRNRRYVGLSFAVSLALHLTGFWAVFGIFTSSYLGRALHNPNYVPHAALLAAILILRLLPTRARVD